MGLLVSTGKFPCGEALVREGLDMGERGAWADSGGPRHWRDYRATNLYSVDPRGRDHDAVMRIGGEAPGRRVHSCSRREGHVRSRLPATSARQRRSVIDDGAPKPGFVLVDRPAITRPLAAQPPAAPRRWSPAATGREAICAPGRRSWSCGCPVGDRPPAAGTIAPG